jgi:hypothetical protein
MNSGGFHENAGCRSRLGWTAGQPAGPSLAAGTKRPRHVYKDNSPSAIAARQRNARTFDDTQYYEHDLRKIPLGTRAWWDQYERERGGATRR